MGRGGGKEGEGRRGREGGGGKEGEGRRRERGRERGNVLPEFFAFFFGECSNMFDFSSLSLARKHKIRDF